MVVKMKKFIYTLTILIIASTSNATARRCLDGAVFDVDEYGKAQLVDCAKWERNPEAILAEQDAINAYTTQEVDFSNAVIERMQPDETPALGKAQNKINETWHNIYQSIFN